jgi:glycosyltransferase involved in cell wall biosynthesis
VSYSLITVIIPAYKCARYLERAVASALEQPQVSEVLLVEDGSPDDTLEVCRKCCELSGRVRLLRHEDGENRGAAATRNLGLAAASGELIAFLDADDFYLPGRFDRAVNLLKADDVDGVYEAVVARFESEEAKKFFMERRGWAFADREKAITTIGVGHSPETLFGRLVGGGAYFCHMNGLTIRARLARASGGFLESLRLHQDLHFLYKLAFLGRLVAGSQDEPVAVRWVHSDNRISHATPDVSRPYRQVLFSDLLFWAYRQRMSRPLFLLILKRYLQLHAVTIGGLGARHPVNLLLRRAVYAGHFLLRPRLALITLHGLLLRA